MMDDVEPGADDLWELDLSEEQIDAMMAAGEPVEIAGPPDAAQLRFELYVTRAHRYRWRLARGKDVLATSKAYRSKKEALRAVEEVIRASTQGLVDRTALLRG